MSENWDPTIFQCLLFTYDERGRRFSESDSFTRAGKDSLGHRDCFFHHLNFFQVRSVNEHAAVISVDILIYFALSVCRSHSSVKSFFMYLLYVCNYKVAALSALSFSVTGKKGRGPIYLTDTTDRST